MHSDPVTLPSAVADADGTATSSWTVPADFAVGEHTVTFASDTDTYEATFSVRAATAAQPASPLAPTDASPASGLFVGAGLMTVLCGAILMLVRRRTLSAAAR